MSRPFRFASPAPAQEHPDWGRFVDAKPDAIYNAWPELADPTDFHYPWAQPLARLWYTATTEPEDLVFNFGEMTNIPLRQQVGILHEAMHLLVDVTRASIRSCGNSLEKGVSSS